MNPCHYSKQMKEPYQNTPNLKFKSIKTNPSMNGKNGHTYDALPIQNYTEEISEVTDYKHTLLLAV
jgi:hypothetical protein